MANPMGPCILLATPTFGDVIDTKRSSKINAHPLEEANRSPLFPNRNRWVRDEVGFDIRWQHRVGSERLIYRLLGCGGLPWGDLLMERINKVTVATPMDTLYPAYSAKRYGWICGQFLDREVIKQ
jgi:hypothetical protein